MLIGAMNHPGAEVIDEIGWIAAMGLDFIDLTLEPPLAASWRMNPRDIAVALKETGLGVVGHTAYYLPLASPFEKLREVAVQECIRCLDLFAAVGARWMNVHPDTRCPMHSKPTRMEKNLQSLHEILQHARQVKVGVMVENVPGNDYNSAEDLGALLQALPELGLHLDIGHCNLSSIPHNAETILQTYGNRLRHVHLHDNKGGTEDLHLALKAGTIDMPGAIRQLKATGYDGTITLEIFSPDRHYLDYSRTLLRKMWDSV